MLGGRDYGRSPFNRATMARRQSGSTFKLFVYLAALRAGLTPDTMVEDRPITIGHWSPAQCQRHLSGRHPAARRLRFVEQCRRGAARPACGPAQRHPGRARPRHHRADPGERSEHRARHVGRQPARNDLGLCRGGRRAAFRWRRTAWSKRPATRISSAPSCIESAAPAARPDPAFGRMRELLGYAVAKGTGHGAELPVSTFGKTGTSQDSRDALFIGFAGDLVVGMWVGNDDNRPMEGVSGGGLPARIWRNFMLQALNLHPAPVVPKKAPERRAARRRRGQYRRRDLRAGRPGPQSVRRRLSVASQAPAEPAPADAQPPISRVRLVKRAIKIAAALFVLAILWLVVTAPLSRSLGPIDAPSITILSAEGEPIARRGATIGAPVDVTRLPPHVGQAFIAIEDRRFFRHVGIDPWGLGRALWRDIRPGRMREGGSTITQQLAKTSFLSPARTPARKAQEALIALWLEARLSKEEILSRYLSNVSFGDNVYGLRAAARHYFNVDPEQLTLAQAAMLAGVVNAPSRLAPSSHLEAARDRARLVLNAMHEIGFLTQAQLAAVQPARAAPRPARRRADRHLFRRLGAAAGGRSRRRRLRPAPCPDHARRRPPAPRRSLGAPRRPRPRPGGPGGDAARRPGRRHGRRQGLCAEPVQPRRPGPPPAGLRLQIVRLSRRLPPRPDAEHAGQRYPDPDRRLVAAKLWRRLSRPRAAARCGRLFEQFGRGADFGEGRPQQRHPGRARPRHHHAAAAGSEPAARGQQRHPAPADRGLCRGRRRPLSDPPARPAARIRPAGSAGATADRPVSRDRAFPMLRDVLYAVVQRGTGRSAALSVPTFGKTGTTSDYRDALFVGFAGDLVVGVWVGNDDNRPLPGTTGGGTPARIWRSFMAEALGTTPARPAPTVPLYRADQQNENAVEANAQEPAPEPEQPRPPTFPRSRPHPRPRRRPKRRRRCRRRIRARVPLPEREGLGVGSEATARCRRFALGGSQCAYAHPPPAPPFQGGEHPPGPANNPPDPLASSPAHLLTRTSLIVFPVHLLIARRRFELSLKPTFHAMSSTLMRVICRYSIASLRRTSSTIAS